MIKQRKKCLIFRVRFINDVVEYWKSPSEPDLRAWLHDDRALNICETIGMEIEQVLLEEAEYMSFGPGSCGRYRSHSLKELFDLADNGCTLLAVA